MKQEIEKRFNLNIARVRNLVQIYTDQLAGDGQGRRGHQETDVLRAAVVLLHASVEDVLRSLAYWKLPDATSDVLERIPLAGGTSTKFTLGTLSAKRGCTVDEIIKESVDASLERSNYNNPREVCALLESIGLNIAPITPFLTDLENTMKRRHQIVHRADKNPNTGSGQHQFDSISPPTVNAWARNVEKIMSAVLSQV